MLDAKPELVNSEPYDNGWMIKLKLSNPEQINDLLTSQAYKDLLGV
jgi:glycine cleavage system H protein